MTSRTLPVTLAFAGVNLLCPSLDAQDSVRLAEVTQTIEYERYLLAGESANGNDKYRNLAWHESGSVTDGVGLSQSASTLDTANIRLSIVDAGSVPLSAADYERLVEQLNKAFDFGDTEHTLKKIEFCVFDVRISPSPHLFISPDELDVTTAASSRSREPLVRDSLAQESAFDFLPELIGDGIPSGDVIPIYVVDASESILGFASTFPHAGPTDVIVVGRELIDGTLPDRAEGRTVAHLIANYLGLKPIWYDETGDGDLIYDTPCHNAPNFGTYAGTIHYSMCEGMPRESLDNMMDNTDERIRKSWTEEQIETLAYWIDNKALRGGLVQGEPCEREVEVLTPRGRDEGLAAGLRGFAVYPNPAEDELVVVFEDVVPGGDSQQSGGSIATLRITDYFGREVITPLAIAELSGQRRLDVADLPAGRYVVRLVGRVGWVATQSFVKL